MPGIQPADVQELLDHGAKVVVLSRGMAECLRVSGETLDFRKEGRIEAHILPTTQAAELQPACKRRPSRGVVSHDLLKSVVNAEAGGRPAGYLVSGTFKGASQRARAPALTEEPNVYAYMGWRLFQAFDFLTKPK